MKDLIYSHLPYLLLGSLALAVLLHDQEIAIRLLRTIPHGPDTSVTPGLTGQRIVALLVLAWCAWRILRKPRR
ncbi:hypothetical protein [Pseudomonas sp. NCCP-436]|uniref:hypothetical protein n=1 Tax=Pseudomonas sp. NCCP-436 TaxID=2842481 RepID=UPI001C81DC17|nr:hypothetical protein [Pseudomonas sp. NCCP-436]GIZ12563.1 hypothetical protein NCCP436_19790 [Pseudomonas sp. NCCP-436]